MTDGEPAAPGPELPEPELPDPELPDPELPDPELPEPELPEPELPEPELPELGLISRTGEFSAYPPIADYGFLSDCEVTALVAPSGAVTSQSDRKP